MILMKNKNRGNIRWRVLWNVGILLLVFCFHDTDAQDSLLKSPIIFERELLRYSAFDLRTKNIFAISPQLEMIVCEYINNEIIFFISSIKSQFDKTQVLRVHQRQKPQVRFNADGNFIEYTYEEKGKRRAGIFDVRFRKNIIVDALQNDIVQHSVSPRSNYILYQTENNDSFPNIWMAEANGRNGRNICDGLLGSWSYNGNWFTVLKPKFYGDWERQSSQKRRNIMNDFLQRMKPNEFSLTWTIWVYNSLGDEVLELKDFDSPLLVLWSPISDRIIVRSYNAYEYQLLEFKETSLGISISTVGRFGFESKREEETHHPVWSFDGKKIVYIKSYWNDNDTQCLKSETWICNADGTLQWKISETDERTTDYPLWSKDGTILILRERLNLSNELELYVVEQTIQNLHELFK